MKILGIETSCDETGMAIFDSERGLLGHVLHSQTETHQDYGGVVPELASRDHIRFFIPLIREVMSQTGCQPKDIQAIAFTAGPGLLGALLVGAAAARSLAWSWDIPAIAVHHLEGHLMAPLLEDPAPEFPFIALLASGGHTQLIEVSNFGRYRLLGETLDDAAGEAFDKTAKLLGLGYPGGPELAKLAKQGKVGRFQFPRPMTDRPGLDFSFSGLKTFAVNTLHSHGGQSADLQTRADIANAFQLAVVDTLLIKCMRALKQTGLKRLVIAGGVSANQLLRQKVSDYCLQTDTQVFYPRHEFCTDNGAMIAFAGYLRLQHGTPPEPLKISARARWPLQDCSSMG